MADLCRDYTCTRCEARTFGIPFGPIREEWCAACHFTADPATGGIAIDFVGVCAEALAELNEALEIDTSSLNAAISAVEEAIASLESESESGSHTRYEFEEIDEDIVTLEELLEELQAADVPLNRKAA